MAHKKSVLELSNVEACCAYLGVEASDKLVSIIDLDEVGTVRYSPKRVGVYGLACSWQDDSDTGHICTSTPQDIWILLRRILSILHTAGR